MCAHQRSACSSSFFSNFIDDIRPGEKSETLNGSQQSQWMIGDFFVVHACVSGGLSGQHCDSCVFMERLLL